MNYNAVINSEPIVLVEFFASWCHHCRRMKPVVDQVEAALSGRAAVRRIDIDSPEADSVPEVVRSVPTFIIYRDGHEVWRHSGEIDGSTLLSKVNMS